MRATMSNYPLLHETPPELGRSAANSGYRVASSPVDNIATIADIERKLDILAEILAERLNKETRDHD